MNSNRENGGVVAIVSLLFCLGGTIGERGGGVKATPLHNPLMDFYWLVKNGVLASSKL